MTKEDLLYILTVAHKHAQQNAGDVHNSSAYHERAMLLQDMFSYLMVGVAALIDKENAKQNIRKRVFFR